MRSHGPRTSSTKVTRIKLTYLDPGNNRRRPPVVQSGKTFPFLQGEANGCSRPEDRFLFKSANLRELHDTRVFPAHAEYFHRSGLRHHTTSVPEEKSFHHRVMRHFHFEYIVTLVEQLLLFTKSFSIFLRPCIFWGPRATKHSLPGPTRQASIPGDYPLRLKNWIARSCFCACWRVSKVPRFLRLPVLGSFFLE
jgi:hypothetical protein